MFFFKASLPTGSDAAVTVDDGFLKEGGGILTWNGAELSFSAFTWTNQKRKSFKCFQKTVDSCNKNIIKMMNLQLMRSFFLNPGFWEYWFLLGQYEFHSDWKQQDDDGDDDQQQQLFVSQEYLNSFPSATDHGCWFRVWRCWWQPLVKILLYDFELIAFPQHDLEANSQPLPCH